jgi:hypothetical protein
VDDVNGLSLQTDSSDEEQEGPQLLELPVPISEITKLSQPHNDFAASLIGYSHGTYNADLVVQACTQDMAEWKDKLKRDLILAAHQPLFEKEVAEAICILANVEKWYCYENALFFVTFAYFKHFVFREVQIVSSHTYIAERHSNTLGVRQGMSQLVADMLESVNLLWKFDTPPEYVSSSRCLESGQDLICFPFLSVFNIWNQNYERFAFTAMHLPSCF